MPNVKSAEKRVRTSQKRALRNRMYRSRVRTAVKKLRQTDDPTAIPEAHRHAVSLIDRAASKGILHRNKAARMKSQLAELVQTKTAPQA